MNNYVSINTPKRYLNSIGRKIVLEQMQKFGNLAKYQIIDKYLYLTSTMSISKNVNKLNDAELCDTNKELIYKKRIV